MRDYADLLSATGFDYSCIRKTDTDVKDFQTALKFIDEYKVFVEKAKVVTIFHVFIIVGKKNKKKWYATDVWSAGVL